MRKALLTIVAVCGLAFMAMAAENAAGTWKATLQTPMGDQENTFALKVDGDKVTGTVSGGMGDLAISNGKIDGDKISFSVTSDFGVLTYAGKISGDDMKLTLTVGDGQFTLDVNAKRQK